MSKRAPKDLSSLVSALTRPRAPVIVTFGEGNEVVDTFGELTYYADTKASLVELLNDLLVGWQGVETLAEVQMPSGRYADVRIAPEGPLRHVILFDATEAALDRRETLQASHETALNEHRRRVALERQLWLTAEKEPKSDNLPYTGVAELLSWDIRARLDEIRGHAQILDDGVAKPSTAAHSIACIKRASMHLHALTWTCIEALHGEGEGDLLDSEPIDIKRLVSELQSQFGEGPQLQEISFETEHRSGRDHVVPLAYAEVYQILVCLITCLLDATGSRLSVKIYADKDHFVSEVCSPSEEKEVDDAYERALHGLLSDPRYATSHHLVAALGGRLVCLQEVGIAVRLELPLIRRFADTPRYSATGPTTILVAIDEPQLCDRVLALVAGLNVHTHTCDSLVDVEREAIDPDVVMIILGGSFAGSVGVGLSYRLHVAGTRRRMLLLRSVAGLGPTAWVYDGRRTIISSDADDGVLRTAIEGALRA